MKRLRKVEIIVLTLAIIRFSSTLAVAQRSEEPPDAPKALRPSSSSAFADVKEGGFHTRTVSRKFLLAHGVWLAANVFDIEMTHEGMAHHKCVEGGFGGATRNPSRSELYATDMSIFAALSGIDYFIQRRANSSAEWKPFRWIPYINPAWGTAVHIKGGYAWYSGCW